MASESFPSAYCAAHPTGTVSPCAACGAARRAAQSARRARRRRFHDCATDGHVPVFDGSCMYCTELRTTETTNPDALAAGAPDQRGHMA